MGNLIFDIQDGISKSISDTPPTHFKVKIELFSLLMKNNIERYESRHFEAGGYKWKLVFYPNGNKNKNVVEHISVYLAMAEIGSICSSLEVYAAFRMFLLDQHKDNYLTLEETTEMGRRFHGTKLEWGFDKFIPLKAFNDASNGYLVDDACFFGAEVFVCKEKNEARAECLLMIKNTISYKHNWKIDKFWDSLPVFYESKEFNAGDHKWKIKLYTFGKDNVTSMNSYLSLYVVLADPTSLPPGSKIYAEFTLGILNQKNSKLFSSKLNHWFSSSSQEWGWSRFISAHTFYPSDMGYLMNDSCRVEAEITVLGVANALG